MAKIIVTLLIILTVGLTGYYFYNNRNLPIQNAPLYSSPAPTQSMTLDLPIDPNRPGVFALGLVYTFTGQLAEIETQGDNIVLVLDKKISEGFPIFVVTPVTAVNKLEGTTSKTASSKDFKVGQNLVIPTAYYPKENVWQVQSVLIQE